MASTLEQQVDQMWPPDKLLVTVIELSQIARMSVKTIYRMVEDGKLKCTRIGSNGIRFHMQHLIDFLSL